MVKAKQIVFAVIGALATVAGLVPAHAESIRIRLHQSDFYARASEGLYAHSDEGGTAQGGNCYVTLSATEAARGIRYWTGKC